MNDEASATHADPARAFDGQYQLGAEIGAGALGVVYRGVDERLDKPVAIKVWHSRLGDSGPQREQYDAEARALTALEHPNVVAITDYGIAGEAPYLIMELLEGQTLEARMRAGALPAALTQTFMQGVLRGLGYMHMRGVMHRNLKPDNVFLHKLDSDSEQLKLLDVGLESLPANTNAGAVQSQSTAYVPPEHDAGTEPDGRSDVYAAGVMMLHMLSGREPTRELVRAAAESADLLEKLLPSAAPEVRAFIARAVATERGSRFGNADQMLRALLELPTPWADDPPGAVAAPAGTKVASLGPQSMAAPAEHAPAEALGETEALATPSEDELIGAPAEANDKEMVLGPIGLMAKLRAHKKLLLIGGGVIGLAAVGGVAALALSGRAAPEHTTELATAEHGEAEGKAKGKGKVAKKAKAAPVEEEEDEEEEEEAEPIIKRVEPGSEHAAAEAPTYAARLNEHGEHGEHGDSPAEAKPREAPAKPVEGAQVAAKPGAEREGAAAKPGQEAAATPVAESPPTAAAAVPAKAATAASGAAEQAAVVPATAAAGGKIEPPVASGKGELAAGEKKAAAVSGEAAAPASAAQAEQPKAPTPEQIGAERHIEPDKDEIRQMLALALAPQPRVAAKNPWDIDVPSSLQALRDAISRGEHGSPGNLRALRRYNSANPQDVYGHLLLAGFYANRGFSLDALDQYDMAFRIDSSSRGAPEMLLHAITMVEQGIADTDAARFLARVYGREASGPIAQRAARSTNPAAVRRLKDAQARLSSAKRR